MTAVPETAAKHDELPELRQDLRLVGRSGDLDGDEHWMIYDPVQHRFVGLDRKSFAIVEAWTSGASVDGIVDCAWRHRAEIVTADDIARLVNLLLQSGLAVASDPARRLTALRATATSKPGAATALLHNYLFFRIPLFNPERILRALLPMARHLGTRRAAVIVALVGIVGLLLASREWDTFTASLASLATLQGAVWLATALLVAKLLHEFAHGLVAMHYGCRVPTLGIAFVLGAPLLYVDVSDAWRLTSARARTAINAAGVAADLAVAAISLTLWSFMPPGVARDIALAFATTGWIMSLAINLNPFMKFDGYHIVADLIGTANLQDRAQSMAQWRCRELLFAPGAEPPESCSRRARTALAAFGVAIWVYRLVLFTGIAIAVYHYFFKLLGIVLFAVEIGWFIVLPLVRELRAWVRHRNEIFRTRRWIASAIAFAVLVVLMLLPWSSAVYVPAVFEPARLARIHVPRAARLIDASLVAGQSVGSGDVLARFAAPDLLHERDIIRLKSAIVELRLARIAGDAADRESAAILQRELAALHEQRVGIERNIDSLKLIAPSSGRIADLASHLRPGRWLTVDEPLTVVHEAGAWEIRGLVDGANLHRLRPGDAATFVPDDLASPSIPATIVEVSRANTNAIEQIELSATYGGRVPTRPGNRSQPIPLDPQYAVRGVPLAPPNAAGEDQQLPRVGLLVVTGLPASLASRLWNRIAQVIVRESGF